MAALTKKQQKAQSFKSKGKGKKDVIPEDLPEQDLLDDNEAITEATLVVEQGETAGADEKGSEKKKSKSKLSKEKKLREKLAREALEAGAVTPAPAITQDKGKAKADVDSPADDDQTSPDQETPAKSKKALKKRSSNGSSYLSATFPLKPPRPHSPITFPKKHPSHHLLSDF